jgi:hypothetical protein
MRTKVWSVTCALVAACAGAPNEAPFSPSGAEAGGTLDSGTSAGAKAQPKSGAAGSSGRPSADAGAMPAARPRDAAQAMPDADMNTNMGIDIDAGSTHDAGTMPDPAVETLHSHADILLQTLMLRFWPTLSANTSVYDWMYAHYWDAVLDATERRGKHAFAATARMFFELQKQRGWFDDFYDDENWVTLALLHAHTVTGEAIYLEQARAVFADIEKAWDETCCGEHKGGLFWKKPAENKVTAINAGAVIIAARLYEATHEAAYLDFAKKAYAFWSQTMVDPKSGHVYDGFDNAGTINKTWRFTYNEGLFIGAATLLAGVAMGSRWTCS